MNASLRPTPLIWSALLLTLALAAGCRVTETPRLTRSVAMVPDSARDHVHVYFVGSPIDAAELGGLPAMKKYFRQIGFENTKHITWTTPSGLADRVVEDHQRDPECRTLLVGWSLGCYQILEASSILEQDRSLQVDRVICLDGNPWVGLQGWRHRYPSHSENVVCIYPPHRKLPDGVANTRQQNVRAAHHFAVPMHEETLDTILHEIAAVTRDLGDDSQSPANIADSPLAPLPENTPRSIGEVVPARQMARSANWLMHPSDTRNEILARSDGRLKEF